MRNKAQLVENIEGGTIAWHRAGEYDAQSQFFYDAFSSLSCAFNSIRTPHKGYHALNQLRLQDAVAGFRISLFRSRERCDRTLSRNMGFDKPFEMCG
jgi:hypothetical protein